MPGPQYPGMLRRIVVSDGGCSVVGCLGLPSCPRRHSGGLARAQPTRHDAGSSREYYDCPQADRTSGTCLVLVGMTPEG